MDERLDEPPTAEERQGAALAVLAVPVVARLGMTPAKALLARAEVGVAMAEGEDYTTAGQWASGVFRTRGVGKRA